MEDKTSDAAAFKSWRSYWHFTTHVKASRRYVWDQDTQAFLNTVAATRHKHEDMIQAGSIVWRAQRGVDWVYDEKRHVEEPVGFHTARMKPVPQFASDGRANSAKIPVLYLASCLKTAISEVRPWTGSEVSVAQFRIIRDLKVIDLSMRYGEVPWRPLTFHHLVGWESPDEETTEEVVWTAIDNAFSEPVALPENVTDYIPTQILAELFLSLGYDAIVYRSEFGDEGYNLALFNVDDAEIINCAPYRVSAIDVEYKEIGNSWFPTVPINSDESAND